VYSGETGLRSRLAPVHVSNMLNITDLVVVMVASMVATHFEPRSSIPQDLCSLSCLL